MERDVEAFIEEVKTRRAIWDVKSKTYGSKSQRIKAWEEVCNIYVPNFSEKTTKEKNAAVNKLQRKWKSLRDCFSRENAKLRKISEAELINHKKYVYYNQLSFLNCLKRTPRGSNKNAQAGNQPKSIANVNRNATVQTHQNAISNRSQIVVKPTDTSLSNGTNSANLKRSYEASDNDPDKQFLLSLLPHVKKISEDVRIDFQSDILQLVRKYMQCNPAPSITFTFPPQAMYQDSSSILPESLAPAEEAQEFKYSDQSMDGSSVSTIEEIKFEPPEVSD